MERTLKGTLKKYSEIVTGSILTDELVDIGCWFEIATHQMSVKVEGDEAYLGVVGHHGDEQEVWVPVSSLRVGTSPWQGDYGRPILVPESVLRAQGVGDAWPYCLR